MGKIKDIEGRVFSRLTAIIFYGYAEKTRAAIWLCRCTCGTFVYVRSNSLLKGNTRSCGCLSKDNHKAKSQRKHKACNGCGITKDRSEFHVCAGKLSYQCKSCYKLYCSSPKFKALFKARKVKIREEVLKHYGGQCACCGEGGYHFLAIDHINGGGTKHTEKIGGELPAWIKRNGFPPGFQVLCHNCNWAKHAAQLCPHQVSYAVASLSLGG